MKAFFSIVRGTQQIPCSHCWMEGRSHLLGTTPAMRSKPGTETRGASLPGSERSGSAAPQAAQPLSPRATRCGSINKLLPPPAARLMPVVSGVARTLRSLPALRTWPRRLPPGVC